MKNVVVTGVSAGIGKILVSVLAGNGWRVFGSVRKMADAEPLIAEFGERFVPLLFDVEDDQAIVAASAAVRARLAGRTLDGLVNNAGIVLAGPLLVQTVADFRKVIEVNLVGMFAVTRAFAPLLGADPALAGPKGRIVNVSSVIGKYAVPFLGALAASKHGVEALSDSLRRELMLVGIDVIVIGPGPIARAVPVNAQAAPPADVSGTIWERPFRMFAEATTNGTRKTLPPEHLCEIVRTALTAPRPKARYAPVRNKLQEWIIPTTLPSRVLDRLIAARFGLRRG